MGQVVQGHQDDGGDFLCLVEVPDIGAGEAAACEARAIFIEWPQIHTVCGVPNVQASSLADEHGAHAGIASGHDAIEHIDAGGDALDEVPWRPDAHEVTRKILGHLIDELLTQVVHFGWGFADGEAADGKPLEGHFDEGLEVPHAHIEFEPALDDAENALMCGVFAPRAPLGPGNTAAHAGLDAIACGGEGGAIVEDHGDIGADGGFDFHDEFGGIKMAASVDVGLEVDAVGVELAHLGEAEHLETAGIGQVGALPGGEVVQTAGFAQQIESGTQIEVIRIGQDNGGVERFDLFDAQGLDGAIGADGHEDGRFDVAVVGMDDATACFTACFLEFVSDWTFFHGTSGGRCGGSPPLRGWTRICAVTRVFLSGVLWRSHTHRPRGYLGGGLDTPRK